QEDEPCAAPTPASPKPGSIDPSRLYRTTAAADPVSVNAVPATSIRPSVSIASPALFGVKKLAGASSRNRPPVPKAVSSDPSGLYRMAKVRTSFTPGTPTLVSTTTFPSDPRAEVTL